MTTAIAEHLNETVITRKESLAFTMKRIIRIAQELESSMITADITYSQQSNKDQIEYMQALLSSIGTWSKYAKDDIQYLGYLLTESI